MPDTLLAIALGPVQDFIKAARRTRDLWFGSKLLSDLSREAARSVAQDAKLIFPAKVNGELPAQVANQIVAVVKEGGCTPQEIAAKAQDAVNVAWLRCADGAREYAAGQGLRFKKELFERQLLGVVEFYAVWTPCASEAEYPRARRRLMRLLAGRKAMREFSQATETLMRVKKSSLDGARESVLDSSDVEFGSVRLQRDLRVRDGEQLDAIGLIKRLGGVEDQDGERRPQYFPSVARIAAETWIAGLASKDREKLWTACGRFTKAELPPINWRHLERFPFDGTIIYRNRHPELKEMARTKDEIAPDAFEQKIGDVARLLKQLEGAYGVPTPYLAILMGDGDKMGAALSTLTSAEKHQTFSKRLARFAGQAKSIVEDKHHGCLIYAGGDDVLAMLPVHTCLDAAQALRDAFAACLEGAMPASREVPTLSIGLAIGHFMEPLEDLRAYAERAENAAKRPDRNALAVHVHTRGGSPVQLRLQWPRDPVGALNKFRNWFKQDEISGKTAYDLREFEEFYSTWPGAQPDSPEADRSQLKAAICCDVERLLRRKKDGATDAAIDEVIGRIRGGDPIKELSNTVAALLIARHIEMAQPRQPKKVTTPS